MFFEKKTPEDTALDAAIERATLELKNVSPVSDEYAKITKQLSKLHALKQAEKPERVSKDTLALIAANLLGIAIIVSHERTHVIATKAGSFVQKLR